jgi:hypothetical protein
MAAPTTTTTTRVLVKRTPTKTTTLVPLSKAAVTTTTTTAKAQDYFVPKSMPGVTWRPSRNMGLSLVKVGKVWTVRYAPEGGKVSDVMTFAESVTYQQAQITLGIMAEVARDSYIGGWNDGYEQGFDLGWETAESEVTAQYEAGTAPAATG